MDTQRPELGAALDHVSIRSADPLRLARFFEDIYGMTRHPVTDGWRCEAPARTFLIAAGRPNSVDYFAYAFADQEALGRWARLSSWRKAVAIGKKTPGEPGNGRTHPASINSAACCRERAKKICARSARPCSPSNASSRALWS